VGGCGATNIFFIDAYFYTIFALSVPSLPQVQDGFRRQRKTQEENISSLLVEANRHLEQLKAMVPREGGGEGGREGGREEGGEKEYQVGEGWPWQR
jgi:hypothetical protein